MGRKLTPIRWTIEKYASEFGINNRTLANRLKQRGILAGEDGKWSSQQMHEVQCGSIDTERLAKLTAERELVEIAVRRERRESVLLSDVERAWTNLVMNFRQRVLRIPSKVAPRLPFCKSEIEMEKEVLQDCEEALIELSKAPDYFPGEEKHNTEEPA